ncbi:MAG: FAD-dependent oxidoreductase [Armatimonadetes bacterium]|nr:FAD-dependent oxidoreductase [Armatimonadota bacterium]
MSPEILLLLAVLAGPNPGPPRPREYPSLEQRTIWSDVCVYGATSTGIMAAIQVRKMGRHAIVVDPGRHLGGLTTGGLGATDIGNRAAIGGMSLEFYQRLRAEYAKAYGENSPQVAECHDGFRFEPHVAAKVLADLMTEYKVAVFLGERLTRVRRQENRILYFETATGHRFPAHVYVDATYEGDLMARAGVAYAVGREGNQVYGETLNGVQPGRPYHNFKVPVDPYTVPGDDASGLLPGIHPGGPGEPGQGDQRVQAYNFRMCLSRDTTNQVPFPKPPNYDPQRYELLLRYLQTGQYDGLLGHVPIPNHKTDTNNNGGFSTDNIGGNDGWADGDWRTRERIFNDHIDYQQGLMYFLSTDERVPEAVRRSVAEWGLAKDEFTDTGNWPPQLYVREARRMVSDYVMTEHDCRGHRVAPDPVGLAAYTMDSHNVQRYVDETGSARNEGDVQVGGFKPYPISYRSIVPRERECRNLFVPAALASSHIAFGSIRMEPVFMILGQSAGTAAVLSMKHYYQPVQAVPYDELHERLLGDRQILEWKASMGVQPILPGSLPGVALDDQDGYATGPWLASSSVSARLLGVAYLHDNNSDKGKCSLLYKPTLPKAGKWEIVLLSPPHANRASNVPVTIAVDGETVAVVRVDQRDASQGGRASLGIFELPAGRRVSVTVSNEGTDGYVVVDGIQFVPAE